MPRKAPGVIDAPAAARACDLPMRGRSSDVNVCRRAARSCRRLAEGRPSDGHRRLHGRQPRPAVASIEVDHGIDRQHTLPRWSDRRRWRLDHVGLMALPLDAGFQSATSPSSPRPISSAIAWPVRRRSASARPVPRRTRISPRATIVVHVDHGIGRYEGLVTLDVGGAPHDCLRVLYDGGDKLFVPVENIEVLSPLRLRGRGRRSSTSSAAPPGRRARRGSSSASATSPAQLIEDRGRAPGRDRADVLQPPEGLYDEFCARFPMPRPRTSSAPSSKCSATWRPASRWTG